MNISLLLAISSSNVIGYYLVEGSIESVMYLDFIIQTEQKFKNKSSNGKKLILMMDNCKIHKNILSNAYFKSNDNLEILFTPNYSPEIHFIEYLFGVIKQNLLKSGFSKNKWNKQIWKDGFNHQRNRKNKKEGIRQLHKKNKKIYWKMH